MAGIYLHIPFCKQACHYCDFYFSTNTGIRRDLISAMAEEISLQRDYLGGDPINTVYFGGGTPSLLEAGELTLLLRAVADLFQLAPQTEVTLEANPDDLTPAKLEALRAAGINRLSIGIQTFDDKILSWLNRAHSSADAVHSVANARSAGFSNISIDLIYAIPGLTNEAWELNIARAIELDVPHISAYTLTIEEKTTFGSWLKKGRLTPVNETTSAEQMEILVNTLARNGYRQYEISNFARPGFESRHNTNYWKGGKYLGIGPSAHSYNGTSRQHNVSNNHLYVRAIADRVIPAEKEMLRQDEQINEYILTSLRTDTGCDLAFLKDQFGYDVLGSHAGYLRQLQSENLVLVQHNHLLLTQAGKLLADKISSDLFLLE